MEERKMLLGIFVSMIIAGLRMLIHNVLLVLGKFELSLTWVLLSAATILDLILYPVQIIVNLLFLAYYMIFNPVVGIMEGLDKWTMFVMARRMTE